jgi:hypothetical protein
VSPVMDRVAGSGIQGTMTQPRNDAVLEPTEPTRPTSAVEPPPPGGRSELAPLPATGALPTVPGTPPVSTAVPVPAARIGKSIPGVQLSQRPRRRGDSFGWPANAAPGKPEGEVDTRP